MAELFNPQDLLFALPLLFGIALSLAQAAGVTDFDFDLDADLDVDADVDVDADAPDADVEGEHDAGFGRSALELLGVGRVPLTLLLISLSIGFGVVGLLVNRAAGALLGPAAWLVSLPVALVASVLTTGKSARLLSRLAPSVETYAESPEALLGRTGIAAVDIDAGFGRAVVHGDDGTRHEVACRSGGPTLPRGSEVLLIQHEADAGRFVVEAFSLVRELDSNPKGGV